MPSPPLLDLAFLNVKHWQSQSDQDNILHVARVPILAIIGADEDDQIKIGQQAVKVPLNGDIKFVEHTGKAIEAGHDSLEKLELQMIQTGAELLVMKPGQRTATESNNEAEGNKSDLQRICRELRRLARSGVRARSPVEAHAADHDDRPGQALHGLRCLDPGPSLGPADSGPAARWPHHEGDRHRGAATSRHPVCRYRPGLRTGQGREEGPPLGTAGNPDPQPPGKGGTRK
jgi:hypothetical protein